MSGLINNFEGLENAENAGGAPWFQIVMPGDVASVPDRILDRIGSAITLNVDAVAYNMMATVGTVFWNERSENVDGVEVYTSTLTWVIPKDRNDALTYARSINKKGVIAIVRDANGQKRLMGTPDEPASFSRVDRSTGALDGSARNEHRYEISISGLDPVPFYEATGHLPYPANAPCPVIPELEIGVYSDAGLTTPITSAAFGDLITITATPTGIIPDQYTFIVPDNFGNFKEVVQGSNTYNYTCAYSGTFNIKIVAEDTVGGGIAVGIFSVTIGSLFSKYSITSAYQNDVTIVDDKVDSWNDIVGTNHASAPSATQRCLAYRNPLSSQCVGVSADVSDLGAAVLITPLSVLTSEVTIYGVFYFNDNKTQGNFNINTLLSSTLNLQQSRWVMFIDDDSLSPRKFRVFVRTSSGEFENSINLIEGKVVFVMKYSGGILRTIINGTTETKAVTGTLNGSGTANYIFMNGLASTAVLPFAMPVYEIGIKTTAISDAEQDQLYADLLVKYPA